MNNSSIIERKHAASILIAVLASYILIFLETSALLWQRWLSDNEPYSHGLIVFPAFIFILLQHTSRSNWAQITPSPLSLLAFALLVIGWYLGYWTNTVSITQTALPFICFFGVAAIFGIQNVKKMVPAFALLLLITPIWAGIHETLRQLATNSVEIMLELASIPAYIDGFYIHLPHGSFEVAAGCSGINYLLAALSLSSIYAALYLTPKQSFIVIGLATILSVVGNWFRIFALIYIGHTSKMESPLMQDHDMFGWWVFFAFLLPLYFVIQKLQYRTDTQAIAENDGVQITNSAKVMAITTVIIGICFAWLITPSSNDNAELMFSGKNVAIPQPPTPNEHPHAFQGYDSHITWKIPTICGQACVLTALVYPNERQGKELVSGTNKVLKPKISRLDSRVTRTKMLSIESIKYQTKHSNHLTSWGYLIGDQITVSGVEAKKLKALGLLTGKELPSALVSITQKCGTDCEEEFKQIETTIVPALEGLKWDAST